jgi:hypothetical protein
LRTKYTHLDLTEAISDPEAHIIVMRPTSRVSVLAAHSYFHYVELKRILLEWEIRESDIRSVANETRLQARGGDLHSETLKGA